MRLMLINFIEICDTFYTEEKRIPRNFDVLFSILQQINSVLLMSSHGLLTIQINIDQFTQNSIDRDRITVAMT